MAPDTPLQVSEDRLAIARKYILPFSAEGMHLLQNCYCLIREGHNQPVIDSGYSSLSVSSLGKFQEPLCIPEIGEFPFRLPQFAGTDKRQRREPNCALYGQRALIIADTARIPASFSGFVSAA